MLQFAGAIILGITLLFEGLGELARHVDWPKLPRLSQAAPANASERTSLRAVDAETVAVTEIMEP